MAADKATIPDSSAWIDRVPPRWRPYLQLMRLDRPIGTWLLFWPCIFGLCLGAIADDHPFPTSGDAAILVIFAVGAIVMRGAGCTYNDIVDRKIDAQVARTRDRPIPSGRIAVERAWAFLMAQCALGLILLLQLNLPAVGLGVFSLALVAVYPFAKRMTWWPQAWLGLTFNWGALLGFVAETGRLDWGAALLYAGLFFWTLGYDTIYAFQDRDDDALIGVKSTARLLGSRAPNWILGFYATSLALLLASGFADHAGWPFAFLMLIAGAHLIWQVHALKIDNADRCLTLFRSNRDCGAMIAAAFLISSWSG